MCQEEKYNPLQTSSYTFTIQSQMAIIPQYVTVLKEENDLQLLHYTEEAPHPGPVDLYKGLVVDGDTVVARSFPWSPTVVSEVLPEDLVYTPLYEATILRFYRVDGKPMVGTHRQIDISNRDSRVTPSSRRFIDLVKEAIASWDYREYKYTTPAGATGKAYTPTSWEELCVEGWCHIFLLVDTSNQITDLTDLSETHEVTDQQGVSDVVTFTTPKLIHALSFERGGDLTPYGLYPMVPHSGQIIYDVPRNKEGVDQYTWLVPSLPVLSPFEAQELIDEGAAVVGFSPLSPATTTKYLSYEYARKLELAGETFNPIHRWHQLMDISIDDATEYVEHLPWHSKHITLRDMEDAHTRHLNKIVSALAPNVVARFNRIDATMDRRLWNKVKDIVNDTVTDLRTKYYRTRPSVKELTTEAEALILEKVLPLSYSEQHALHRTIQRVDHDSV